MPARSAYLTIDDAPSAITGELTDFLQKRDIPALFFCRGDFLEERMDTAAEAVARGFHLGNHTYSHSACRALETPFDVIRKEIARTEDLLDRVYSLAGVKRPARWFRFPHLDRGMGAVFIEPENVQPEHLNMIDKALGGSLNTRAQDLTPEIIAHKNRIQDYLKQSGFSPAPTRGDYPDWFRQSGMMEAQDWLATYSAADWMLLNRHRGKWDHKTVDDLKVKFDQDVMETTPACHILLCHDDPEIYDVTTALIDHWASREMVFLDPVRDV